LIILNEDGAVVGFKIVSNDRREELYMLLLEVWAPPDRQHITTCIYSDNPKVDEASIQRAFTETLPEDEHIHILKVLLDIFHAKSRVVKELPRSHPDRKSSIADLTTIFAKLHHYNAYPNISKLKGAFKQWMNKYNTVHAELSLTLQQKVDLLGTLVYSCLICLAENKSKKGGTNKNSKNEIRKTLDSIITLEVEHQVQLLIEQPNLSCLWNIKFFSIYGLYFNVSISK
jgi:hypothetical protein